MKKQSEPLTASDSVALDKRLGKEPDAAIGRDYNLSRESIRQRRATKGIPPYKREFRAGNKVVATTTLTKEDARQTARAMKKTGASSRGEYIRGAVRDKNKEVMG
jgi:hypothetical protein